MAIVSTRGYALPLNLAIQRPDFTGAVDGQVVKLGAGRAIIVTRPGAGDVVVYKAQIVDAAFAAEIGAKPWGRRELPAGRRGVGWHELWNDPLTLVGNNYEAVPDSIVAIDPDDDRTFATNAQVQNAVAQLTAAYIAHRRGEAADFAREWIVARLAETNRKLTAAQRDALPAQVMAAFDAVPGLVPPAA
jgi:hypothetical protein